MAITGNGVILISIRTQFNIKDHTVCGIYHSYFNLIDTNWRTSKLPYAPAPITLTWFNRNAIAWSIAIACYHQAILNAALVVVTLADLGLIDPLRIIVIAQCSWTNSAYLISADAQHGWMLSAIDALWLNIANASVHSPVGKHYVCCTRAWNDVGEGVNSLSWLLQLQLLTLNLTVGNCSCCSSFCAKYFCWVWHHWSSCDRACRGCPRSHFGRRVQPLFWK